jgi:integrase/recombinase XerD
MAFDPIKLEPGIHQGKDVVFIRFPFNREIINLIKKVDGVRWSATQRAWYMPFTEDHLNSLAREVEAIVTIEFINRVSPVYKPDDGDNGAISAKISQFKDWMSSKRLAESTIKTYSAAMQVFLNFFPGKKPEEITCDDVIRFNNEYLIRNKRSHAYQNQMVSAIKKFFLVIENKAMDLDLIHRPKSEHPLLRVISKEDIKSILGTIKNLKHRAMISLIYSCGLRRGELIGLEQKHIDFNRKILLIVNGKGNKDRIVPLSDKIISLLQEYIELYKPKTWLFEGQRSGHPYGERSLQLVLKQAIKRAGFDEAATLHWLRHSYATHLHERGTDIEYIRRLLGHKSIKTTEQYIHVSRRSIENIRSPFDDL